MHQAGNATWTPPRTWKTPQSVPDIIAWSQVRALEELWVLSPMDLSLGESQQEFAWKTGFLTTVLHVTLAQRASRPPAPTTKPDGHLPNLGMASHPHHHGPRVTLPGLSECSLSRGLCLRAVRSPFLLPLLLSSGVVSILIDV